MTTPRAAGAQASRPLDLSLATIDDLMKIVVTTASREPERIGSAPARIQVITAAQIERRGCRSLQDVVFLMDGIRVSSPTNEPLPIAANYPVHNARQVDVVYGPASALYGATPSRR